MTGYTVHAGSTEKFSEGWDRIFGATGHKSRKRATSKESKSARDTDQTAASAASRKKTSKG